jgi:S1-C subfamily serine protease
MTKNKINNSNLILRVLALLYIHAREFGINKALVVLALFLGTLVLAGCSTTCVGGYGYTSRYFEERGWMEVNRFEPGANTPYKRITYEMRRNENIKKLISDQGMPDYYYTTDLWDVYYGYKSSGIIYHLNINTGEIIEQFRYSKISSILPQNVVAGFESAKREDGIYDPKEKNPEEIDQPNKENESIIGSGTGFFITDDGYVLTNNHVLHKANKVYILVGKKAYSADIIAIDSSNDIALLKVDYPSKGILLDYANADKGETVATFGYPLIDLQGAELKATFGHINSLSGIGGDIRYYQIDTPIQPGSSGGPLTNSYGAVVGIVSFALSQEASIERSGTINQNCNYAVKIGYALPMISQYKLQLTKVNHKKKLSNTELVKKIKDSVVIVISKR